MLTQHCWFGDIDLQIADEVTLQDELEFDSSPEKNTCTAFQSTDAASPSQLPLEILSTHVRDLNYDMNRKQDIKRRMKELSREQKRKLKNLHMEQE